MLQCIWCQPLSVDSKKENEKRLEWVKWVVKFNNKLNIVIFVLPKGHLPFFCGWLNDSLWSLSFMKLLKSKRSSFNELISFHSLAFPFNFYANSTETLTWANIVVRTAHMNWTEPICSPTRVYLGHIESTTKEKKRRNLDKFWINTAVSIYLKI